jgi:hypothetical protein
MADKGSQRDRAGKGRSARPDACGERCEPRPGAARGDEGLELALDAAVRDLIESAEKRARRTPDERRRGGQRG